MGWLFGGLLAGDSDLAKLIKVTTLELA